jgi:hypothetical protein
MAKLSEWTKLVQKTYYENKHKIGYKLKNAMADAKKIYEPKNKDDSEKKHDLKTKKRRGKTNRRHKKHGKTQRKSLRKGGN